MEENTAVKKKGFTSRWGLIATLIGLAIGTGNIWRFPRIAAMNGGGAFVVAWTVMLLIAAIPLAIAEMAIGRSTRRACPGAFKDILGKKYTWMGVFMSLVVLNIASYYTVVMSWVLRYLFLSVTGGLFGISDKMGYFSSIANGNWGQWAFFLVSLLITWFITSGGVQKRIEKFMSVCIPFLFVLLVIVVVRALTLGQAAEGAAGAGAGLDFFFRIDPARLATGNTWLQALVQILWSVGVGWGLVICYGAFTQSKSDVALNGFIQGFGNNIASLLAGCAVIPTLFAYNNMDEALAICASGGNSMTFDAMATIFEHMPGGQLIAIAFFLALLLAALSSNLGHFLVVSLPLEDYGVSKKKGCNIALVAILLLGTPSALSLNFRDNQDFVSGIGLVVGILFTCFLLWKVGASKFRSTFINIPENELHCGKWWDILVKFVAPITAIVLIVWSFTGLLKGENPWNIFAVESAGTLLLQLGLYVVLSMILAGFINKSKTQQSYYNGKTFPDIPDNYD